MTLFSASRYMGTYSNKGAFLVLEHGMKKNLQQFIAHSMGAVNLQAAELADRRQEQEILSMVVQHVVNKKPELYWFLTHADTKHVGTVSKLEWADAMRTVLGLDLPWLRLSTKLAHIHEGTGRINYGRFLDRYGGWVWGWLERTNVLAHSKGVWTAPHVACFRVADTVLK